jgi:Beta-propeller repeat
MMNRNDFFGLSRFTLKGFCIFLLILFSTSAQAQLKQGINSPLNKSVSFRENKGQVGDQNSQPRPDVLFSGTDGQLVYHLKKNGISYQLSRVDSWKEQDDLGGLPVTEQTKIPDQTTMYRLDVNWLNANASATVTKGEAIPGLSNFYNAVCPNGVTGVQSFDAVTYQQIYSGINLKWYSKENQLKYDYIVAAGADYKQIQLQFEGAESLRINANGELMIKTPLGELIEQAPVVLQNEKMLPSKWIIKNNIVSFQIENIDPNQAFTIDPFVRVWGTYYGGATDELAYSCATDLSSNVYIAGLTNSITAIATSGAHQTVYSGGSYDAYLAKMSGAGVIQWATYYGGTAIDFGFGVTTDLTGNVYLTGYSASLTAIATVGSHQNTYGGGVFDAFLVQFNGSGVRQWATYYGGTSQDRAYSCVTDGSGNVYLTGFAQSATGIASAGAYQPTLGGGSDAFVVKFLSNGTRVWATYLGGTSNEISYSICIDLFGFLYV